MCSVWSQHIFSPGHLPQTRLELELQPHSTQQHCVVQHTCHPVHDNPCERWLPAYLPPNSRLAARDTHLLGGCGGDEYIHNLRQFPQLEVLLQGGAIWDHQGGAGGGGEHKWHMRGRGQGPDTREAALRKATTGVCV